MWEEKDTFCGGERRFGSSDEGEVKRKVLNRRVLGWEEKVEFIVVPVLTVMYSHERALYPALLFPSSVHSHHNIYKIYGTINSRIFLSFYLSIFHLSL